MTSTRRANAYHRQGRTLRVSVVDSDVEGCARVHEVPSDGFLALAVAAAVEAGGGHAPAKKLLGTAVGARRRGRSANPLQI